MTLSHIEEYSFRSISVFGCKMHSQITVENVTQLKAVLTTVKIFAVYKISPEVTKLAKIPFNSNL